MTPKPIMKPIPKEMLSPSESVKTQMTKAAAAMVPFAKSLCPVCNCTDTKSYNGCTHLPLSSSFYAHPHTTRHNHRTWSPLHLSTDSSSDAADVTGQALAAFHALYPSPTLIPTLGVDVDGCNADCKIDPSQVLEVIKAYQTHGGGTALGLYA